MSDGTGHDPASPALDTSTRLAYENVFLAHERTQIAWVQVALALISFGFTIAKVVEMLHEKRAENAPHVSAATVGIFMIVLGLVSLALSSVQHQFALRRMRARCPDLPWSSAGILSVLLAALGVVALLGVALRT